MCESRLRHQSRVFLREQIPGLHRSSSSTGGHLENHHGRQQRSRLGLRSNGRAASARHSCESQRPSQHPLGSHLEPARVGGRRSLLHRDWTELRTYRTAGRLLTASLRLSPGDGFGRLAASTDTSPERDSESTAKADQAENDKKDDPADLIPFHHFYQALLLYRVSPALRRLLSTIVASDRFEADGKRFDNMSQLLTEFLQLRHLLVQCSSWTTPNQLTGLSKMTHLETFVDFTANDMENKEWSLPSTLSHLKQLALSLEPYGTASDARVLYRHLSSFTFLTDLRLYQCGGGFGVQLMRDLASLPRLRSLKLVAWGNWPALTGSENGEEEVGVKNQSEDDEKRSEETVWSHFHHPLLTHLQLRIVDFRANQLAAVVQQLIKPSSFPNLCVMSIETAAHHASLDEYLTLMQAPSLRSQLSELWLTPLPAMRGQQPAIKKAKWKSWLAVLAGWRSLRRLFWHRDEVCQAEEASFEARLAEMQVVMPWCEVSARTATRDFIDLRNQVFLRPLERSL